MSEWTLKKLSDVVELRRGFDLPHKQRESGPCRVLSAGETVGWHKEGPIKGPGFVVGRATNLGVPTWSNDDFWPLNTTLYAADFKGNDPKFLFHLFETLDLSGYDSGSVQPMLNRNYISHVEVCIPDLPVQRAIVEVLGALDDKIAVNDRAVLVARQLGRALFRAAAAAGPVRRIDEIASLITRGVTPTYTTAEGMVVINQKCVRDHWVDLRQARMMERSGARADRVLRRDDVLVNSTGQGTLGRVARWIIDKSDITIDTHVTLVRFDISAVEPACAGLAMLEVESRIEALAEGSTGQTELRRDLLSAIELRLPVHQAQHSLGLRLRQLDDLATALTGESDRLAETRDQLLPLLMSGKVRVRDAERVASDVL